MNKAVYILLTVLLSTHVFAQDRSIQSFSLQQAVEYAKKNNYTLKNSQLDVIAAQKKVKEILASGLPQVNGSANFTNNITVPTMGIIDFPGIPPTPAKFGQPYTAVGSLTASQLLFDGGFLMGVKAAKEYVALSEINVNRTNIETEVNVSKAYYGALLLKTNITLINKNLETLAKTQGDMEKMGKAGLVQKTDVDRITLQHSSLQLQLSKIQDQQRIALMILKLQMGLNVNDSIVLTDDLQKMYDASKTAQIESKTDYNNRTEYQLLNQQIKLNIYDKKRYQFGYAPSLSAVISTQRNAFGNTISELTKEWYPGTFWGLNLNVPIFDGLRKSAQIQQAKINITKAENDKRMLENAIEQQIVQSRLSFTRASEQLSLQEQNLKLAQDIYDRVQIKYNNGMGSSLELTTAQNDLETARTNYLSTVYDYFVTQIELKKAKGDIK